GRHTSQRQALVSGPYVAAIPRDNAKVELCCLRKRQRSKRNASEEVEAGVCPHPNAPLTINEHLPCGVGTESFLGCEALARSVLHRFGRLPGLHVFESPHALIGHCPKRTVGREREVSESNIVLAPSATWRGQDRFTCSVPNLAKPIIVRQPDSAIWSLMEKGAMSRRHQDESRGHGTGIVSKGLEPGLPQS